MKLNPTKNSTLLKGLAFALLVIIAVSCKKEIAGVFQKPLDPKIEWAKSYYEHTLEPTTALVLKPGAIMSADGKKGNAKSNKLSAKWGDAVSETTRAFEYVETPLSYEHKLSTTFSIVNDPEKTPTVNEDVIKASFDRLVIYKDKKA